jgi:hypothetical protein
MDSPLSITSSVISILTLIVTIIIWLGQHLDRAIRVDNEIATTAVMLLRSCGQTVDMRHHLDNNSDLYHRVLEMWQLNMASIAVLMRVLRLSAAKRYLEWDNAQSTIRDNAKEVKRIGVSVNALTLFSLPR